MVCEIKDGKDQEVYSILKESYLNKKVSKWTIGMDILANYYKASLKADSSTIFSPGDKTIWLYSQNLTTTKSNSNKKKTSVFFTC